MANETKYDSKANDIAFQTNFICTELLMNEDPEKEKELVRRLRDSVMENPGVAVAAIREIEKHYSEPEKVKLYSELKKDESDKLAKQLVVYKNKFDCLIKPLIDEGILIQLFNAITNNDAATTKASVAAEIKKRPAEFLEAHERLPEPVRKGLEPLKAKLQALVQKEAAQPATPPQPLHPGKKTTDELLAEIDTFLKKLSEMSAGWPPLSPKQEQPITKPEVPDTKTKITEEPKETQAAPDLIEQTIEQLVTTLLDRRTSPYEHTSIADALVEMAQKNPEEQQKVVKALLGSIKWLEPGMVDPEKNPNALGTSGSYAKAIWALGRIGLDTEEIKNQLELLGQKFKADRTLEKVNIAEACESALRSLQEAKLPKPPPLQGVNASPLTLTGPSPMLLKKPITG